MHRWGYAPTLDVLARDLLGGTVSSEALAASIRFRRRIRMQDRLLYLEGRESLVERSIARLASNHMLNGRARDVAIAYVRDIARHCPFVECAALSGSVASGGFAAGDDVDFDLIVRPRTKYASYLIATLIGLRYSWKFRNVRMDGSYRTPFLPKITCINVVWSDDQTAPFLRQDASLAFELLRCEPLYGVERFVALLRANPWIHGFFPQAFGRRWKDVVREERSPIGASLAGLAGQPRILRLLEALSRKLAWAIYRFVQLSRSGNPAAAERLAFLRRVKFPYEVFQD